LALASIGVAYGDIGRALLYASGKRLPRDNHGMAAVDAVYGVLSLIIWSLLLTVTLNTCSSSFVPTNKGEGGTFALMALGNPRQAIVAYHFSSRVMGASFFLWRRHPDAGHFGLSAVEGSKLMRRSLNRAIVPAPSSS